MWRSAGSLAFIPSSPLPDVGQHWCSWESLPWNTNDGARMGLATVIGSIVHERILKFTSFMGFLEGTDSNF